jgi:hypothetical protein
LLHASLKDFNKKNKKFQALGKGTLLGLWPPEGFFNWTDPAANTSKFGCHGTGIKSFMQQLKMLNGRSKRIFILFASCLLCITLFLGGCKPGEENQDNNGGNSNVFSNQCEELGPAPIGGTSFYTGRVSAIGVSTSNPELYYVGGADGGVWKSLDGGNLERSLIIGH